MTIRVHTKLIDYKQISVRNLDNSTSLCNTADDLSAIQANLNELPFDGVVEGAAFIGYSKTWATRDGTNGLPLSDDHLGLDHVRPQGAAGRDAGRGDLADGAFRFGEDVGGQFGQISGLASQVFLHHHLPLGDGAGGDQVRCLDANVHRDIHLPVRFVEAAHYDVRFPPRLGACRAADIERLARP